MCIFLCSDSLIITNFRQIFDFLYLQFNGALVCRDDCATKSEKSERQVEKDPSSFDLSVFTYDFQFAKWNDHQVNRMLATTSIERLPSQTFKRKHSKLLFVRTASFITRSVLLTVQVKYISVLSKYLRGKVRKLRELESFYASP